MESGQKAVGEPNYCLVYFATVDSTPLEREFGRLLDILETEDIVVGPHEVVDGVLGCTWESPGKGISKAAEESIFFVEEGDSFPLFWHIDAWAGETSLPLSDVDGNDDEDQYEFRT
jgi:hypothetical protein